MKFPSKKLPTHIAKAKELLYDRFGFRLENFQKNTESLEYEACSFRLESAQIICRTARITPKKVGQFVTIWKRNSAGITKPFQESDIFDFIVIHVQNNTCFGQFVFPKSILVQKRIVSSKITEGKRGIRVYPPWDVPTSKQALKTQAWQLQYFLPITKNLDKLHVESLYTIKFSR